ncbi:MAG TPA: sensor histidine kinase [Miltoncostaea sp.]|nr:sensor histidine kinase [Miltoncostaea sp.]
MRWPLYAAWACAAAAVAGAVGAFVFRAADPAPGEAALETLLEIAVGVPALAAGVAIARGRPRNAVGAVVAAIGLVVVADAFVGRWASAAVHGEAAGAGWAALAFDADWIPTFGLLALLLLLFPDGRPLSPRWRWAVALTIAATLLACGTAVLRDEPFDAPYDGVAPPVGVLPDAAAGVLMAVCLPLLMVALALAAVAVILRFRRSRGVERTQMKWLAAAAALLPLALVAGIIDGFLNDSAGPLTLIPFLAVYVALVAAVVVAMLRHGLYDVDRVISRTIAWVALTILLAGGAVGVALLVADPLGGGSTAGAAVAAVTAALAFDPLRRRLQRVVDRRFDRDRAHAIARIDAFADRVHDGEAEPEEIEGLLRDVLGDPRLRLLVWLPGPGIYAGLDGAPASPPVPGPGTAVTAVGRGDAPLALMVHDPRLAERSGLLAEVLRAAALPVEAARLRGELRGRLEEVEESRARIVRAGYEERRRLERDLHDGAQQRLLALGMALRRVQRRVSGDPEAARALDDAVDGVAEAVRDLREIARGLRPGMLDDGLGPALADLARRTPLAVDVDAPAVRVAPEIETAAYYVVSEALANAVKHASASRVTVSARQDDGHLVVRVADDGRGGATAETAGGLAGLADRVAAHGGRMALESAPGAGTRIEVVLPCGS